MDRIIVTPSVFDQYRVELKIIMSKKGHSMTTEYSRVKKCIIQTNEIVSLIALNCRNSRFTKCVAIYRIYTNYKNQFMGKILYRINPKNTVLSDATFFGCNCEVVSYPNFDHELYLCIDKQYIDILNELSKSAACLKK